MVILGKDVVRGQTPQAENLKRNIALAEQTLCGQLRDQNHFFRGRLDRVSQLRGHRCTHTRRRRRTPHHHGADNHLRLARNIFGSRYLRLEAQPRDDTRSRASIKTAEMQTDMPNSDVNYFFIR
jgi:hypothetical protein